MWVNELKGNKKREVERERDRKRERERERERERDRKGGIERRSSKIDLTRRLFRLSSVIEYVDKKELYVRHQKR